MYSNNCVNVHINNVHVDTQNDHRSCDNIKSTKRRSYTNGGRCG